MDDNDESVNNMVSNLPLLFANGYPTALEKITEAQIQNFIPFMVQCSLGNINVPGKEEYSEPEWWPEDIEFSIPITKPKKFQGDWLQKMKEIVRICYQFHKSIFLLRFCNDLAAYEHTWLRFINNHNSTTSLYDRRSNKLLVTFRNENMSYDQPPQKRKCLLQQKARSQTDNNQQQMVEPALFDIYLCDNCDAELYSHEAFIEHEKICTAEDDDVILCNSPLLESESANLKFTCSTSDPLSIEANENSESRKDFLLNFNLRSRISDPISSSSSSCLKLLSNDKKTKETTNTSGKITNKSLNTKNHNDKITSLIYEDVLDMHTNQNNNKKPKITRNNRTIYALSRCPNIPFSSPAGQLLIKTCKSYINEEYLMERLDRAERFCSAPVIPAGSQRPPKFFNKRHSVCNFNCTFRKPNDYSTHRYTFPRKQYYSQYRADSLKFLNDLLLRKRCRPISVRLKKITENEIKRRKKIAAAGNSDLNIKLIRDQSHGSIKWKITNQQKRQQQKQQQQLNNQKQIVVDTINLCSSDEEENNSIDKSKTYFNGGLSIAQFATAHLDLQDDDEDDDITEIVDECPAEPDIPIVPILLSKKHPNKSPRVEIQKIFKKYTDSEITLTPVKKLEKLSPQEQINNISAGSPTTNSNSLDEIRKQNKFEGNFLLSSQGVTNQTKPLQPSVFLFSNYTTNAVAATAAAAATTMALNQQINNEINNSSNNQENLVDSNFKKDDLWLPNNNNITNSPLNSRQNSASVTNNVGGAETSSTTNNLATNKLIQLQQLMQFVDNDVTINKISSPNRTLSIDLTL